MTDKQICSALFSISKLLEDKTRRGLETHGIFQGQGKALIELSKNDGITQIEIARSLDISPATVTNLVKRMEANKLVKRSSDKKDERIVRVSLTKDGIKAAQKVNFTWEVVDKEILSVLSDEEQGQFQTLLKKIQSHLLSKDLSGNDA